MRINNNNNNNNRMNFTWPIELGRCLGLDRWGVIMNWKWIIIFPDQTFPGYFVPKRHVSVSIWPTLYLITWSRQFNWRQMHRSWPEQWSQIVRFYAMLHSAQEWHWVCVVVCSLAVISRIKACRNTPSPCWASRWPEQWAVITLFYDAS